MISDEAQVPHYQLPDPLIRGDGTPVRSAAQWRERRREIVALFAEHVYGRTPAVHTAAHAAAAEADSDALAGAAIRRQSRLTLSLGGSAIELALLEYVPADRPGPLPVIIAPNFHGNHTVDADPAICIGERPRRASPALPRGAMAHRFPLAAILGGGFRLVTFHYEDVVPDADDLGAGACALFPRGAAGRAAGEWGAIGAWAWASSRVLDSLSADPGVDRERVIVAGHSRLGKAALWAAAQDERFAAVFANDSGCTGAAIARRRFGETVAAINGRFPHWFCRNYHAYAEREDALPVDQHELIAAIAPRPVYIASAADDLWADPHGEFLGAVHASPVYRLLGDAGLTIAAWPPSGTPSEGAIGYHLRPGGHDLLASDWEQFLDFIARRA